MPIYGYGDQTVAHAGSYDYLYNTVYASSSNARNALTVLKSNMDTYGIAINGCDSGASQLQYSSTYSYCTMANWYTDYTDYSGTGVFCFTTLDLCKKFSGLRTDDYSYNSGNKTYLAKGYYFDYDAYPTAITYLNSDSSSAKRILAIANDEMFTCNQTCADDTGWTSATKTDGTPYEQWYTQYCPNSTTSTCTKNYSSRKFRCPASYYNAQGTSAMVSGATTTLTCTPCPSLPKRDGTTCTISQPGAGMGTNITYCMLAAGCESYDDTGDYLLAGQCYYN